GILEKRPDGKQQLFIPEDLQLWEMVGVMEVVDHDTFAAKPERQTEAKGKLHALAQTFQDSGIYIAQRLEGVHEGREVAEALAQEFYEYGRSLAEGKKPETPLGIADIASQKLTPEETETIDRYLAGGTLYTSRQKRVEQAIARDSSKKDELYEAERQRTLSQFFRVAEKAFALKSKSTDGELQKSATQLKPWQNDAPIHSTFLAKIEKAMMQKIETPKREFEMAIFRRGLEKLTTEMREHDSKNTVNSFFEKLDSDLQIEQKKLVDVLGIPELKTELEAIRRTGNPAEISQKEREIADIIQRAVSSFPYHPDANNPAEMVANQYINCVGASTLGGALMKEAGLNYLVGDVPEHSITVLVTDDGKIFWYDMLGSLFNGKEIKDSDVRGTSDGDNQITVKDIVDFSRNPSASPGGMRIQIPPLWYRLNMGKLGKFSDPYLIVFPPEYGQQIQILNNTGAALSDLGRNEEAIEAYRQAVALDPKDAYPYNGLGSALSDLGRNEEAIEAYWQAVAIDPKDAYSWNGLGNALHALGRNEEAIETYRQAVAIDPKDAYSWNGLGNALHALGRNEEAIEAYRRFIDLADKKADDYWIKRAEGIITELKE
ncbi:tetratricopeptide repeat protein, partial [bacterium]|nr:tetratricopeptide repeat protein [bacterium]